MTIEEFLSTLNRLGGERVPFLFLVDFEMRKPVVITLGNVNDNDILFDVQGFTNASAKQYDVQHDLSLQKYPIAFNDYKNKFDFVFDRLSYGDSFLTNLTASTEIKINTSLRELFFRSKAKYKLCYKDQFLFFSPETFIQISEGKIFSYPMKGTIDADLPDAENIIVNDQKELAEHVTIVDLIRNDLSQIATDVKVSRFRYIEEIKTNTKNLLQVSSKIEGQLSEDYLSKLGSIIVSLLPAGSVSGAPKKKTLEIIHQAEGEERGYYTGVFGYFDGNKLDSAVMIRYIENKNDKLFYRSGGGITTQSVVEGEYQEMIDKVYVPLT
ncbi:MAG TPA: aminodeoxychorismate synthase component I [Cyclobacteriaceae bacterium]|nr:aminodeoxychorismate synthase component I [Cyclobacteriaceae bacterium]